MALLSLAALSLLCLVSLAPAQVAPVDDDDAPVRPLVWRVEGEEGEAAYLVPTHDSFYNDFEGEALSFVSALVERVRPDAWITGTNNSFAGSDQEDSSTLSDLLTEQDTLMANLQNDPALLKRVNDFHDFVIERLELWSAAHGSSAETNIVVLLMVEAFFQMTVAHMPPAISAQALHSMVQLGPFVSTVMSSEETEAVALAEYVATLAAEAGAGTAPIATPLEVTQILITEGASHLPIRDQMVYFDAALTLIEIYTKNLTAQPPRMRNLKNSPIAYAWRMGDEETIRKLTTLDECGMAFNPLMWFRHLPPGADAVHSEYFDESLIEKLESFYDTCPSDIAAAVREARQNVTTVGNRLAVDRIRYLFDNGATDDPSVTDPSCRPLWGFGVKVDGLVGELGVTADLQEAGYTVTRLSGDIEQIPIRQADERCPLSTMGLKQLTRKWPEVEGSGATRILQDSGDSGDFWPDVVASDAAASSYAYLLFLCLACCCLALVGHL
ncbi:unnamed protein product [Vitrella brassicaformis CCMP3155]|uniref:Uncharacterized protein n=2 Tax=Vitrella brassicaformis TaxID=1169539 RepID=A0A0G4EMW1_VITBC|nr:unnamed protein product [Vitrella brassicaformis CCMP3155]|eukprot:CEL98506.1 unnamed protein product [Vitrella brassicaformis CCMP3155]